MQCPRCKAPLRDGAFFCDKCGFALQHTSMNQAIPSPVAPEVQYIRCARCNERTMLGTQVCPNCGNNLTYRHDPNASVQPTPKPNRGGRRVIITLIVALIALWAIARLSSGTPSTAGVRPTEGPVSYIEVEDVRELVKDPGAYEGKALRLEGEVFTIQQDNGHTAMQISVKYPGGDEFDREAVIVRYDGTSEGLYEKSHVYVWGRGGGELEGTNAFGGSVSQPLINADRISY